MATPPVHIGSCSASRANVRVGSSTGGYLRPCWDKDGTFAGVIGCAHPIRAKRWRVDLAQACSSRDRKPRTLDEIPDVHPRRFPERRIMRNLILKMSVSVDGFVGGSYRLQTAKRPETRARRFALLLQMMRTGKRLH